MKKPVLGKIIFAGVCLLAVLLVAATFAIRQQSEPALTPLVNGKAVQLTDCKVSDANCYGVDLEKLRTAASQPKKNEQ